MWRDFSIMQNRAPMRAGRETLDFPPNFKNREKYMISSANTYQQPMSAEQRYGAPLSNPAEI
jgi:hypothetical protein